MSTPSKAVFLSYASQDAEAARSTCDELRAAGVEGWFDQSELPAFALRLRRGKRGGDAWDGRLRREGPAVARDELWRGKRVIRLRQAFGGQEVKVMSGRRKIR